MKVLYKAPDTTGFEEREISNNDKAMQRLVGGRPETVSLTNDYILVYNGYGESQNQPRNVVIKTAFGQKLIVGSFFICRMRGRDFMGLNSQNLNERDKLYGLITHTYTDNVAYLAMTGGVRA